MGNKKCISYGTIFKRSSCLNSTLLESKITDAGKILEKLEIHFAEMTRSRNTTDGSISPSVKNSLSLFMEGICDFTNANKYYQKPLYLMEKLNSINGKAADEILVDYTSRVLPYVEDLSMIEESVNRYNLTDKQRDKIIEEANMYTVADRILQNHNRISKRFNIELEVSKIRSKGLKNITESCCTMIDTFKIHSYQKLNICMEELTYLLQKNSLNYDPADLAYYVTEYFVLRSPNLDKEIGGYRKALMDSYCLEDTDLSRVDYIFKESVEECGTDKPISIKTEIEKFFRDSDKTARRLEICVNRCLDNNSNNDIIRNIDKLIFLLFDVQKSGICDQGPYFKENLTGFFDRLVRRVETGISAGIGDFNSDDIDALIRNIESVKSVITSNVDDTDEYSHIVFAFKAELNALIAKLKTLNNIAYGYYNINTLNKVNEANDSLQSVEEFKVFKFHNLINAATNLDKFLKRKEKAMYEKGSKKVRNIIRRVKDVLIFGENTIYNYIGEDNRVDICVAQYYINESEMDNIHKVFEEACKEYNYEMSTKGYNDMYSYYITNPGILEVHLKDTTNLDITEEDAKIIRESESPDLDIYVEEFANIQAIASSIKNFTEDSKVTIESLQDKLFRFGINYEGKEFNIDHYKIAMECLSLLNASKEDVDVFSEKFSGYRYSSAVLESVITEAEYNKENQTISYVLENWNKVDFVPLDIQWEAYQILSTVLEDAPGKEDKKVSDAEFKKNPFKGININSIYLYLEGLKAKTKDMSQKEKEMSRNMDNNFRLFVKGMKNALISDRREAIIKGSVIPSFSRCVKLCIGLAGLGVVSGNPLVPVIVAMGGFAMSKRLTAKERVLLLDEIEIELEVLDKEIAAAESRNQLKKYRELLRYKKDLQRQYQRIRYNLRVGKDILPGSAAGMRHNDD